MVQLVVLLMARTVLSTIYCGLASCPPVLAAAVQWRGARRELHTAPTRRSAAVVPCRPNDGCHEGLLRGAAGCSFDVKHGTEHDIPWLGTVSDGASSRSTMTADVADVQDGRDKALGNRGVMPPQRWLPRGLVAWCSWLFF